MDSRVRKPTIGGTIRAARLAAGLTQTELADRLGTAQANVSGWETGQRRPTPESLFAVGRVLGKSTLITADGVVFVDPDTVRWPPEAD